MIFSDPFPRVVAVPPRNQRRASLLGRLCLVMIVLAVLWHVANIFRNANERTSPAHVTHAHKHPARYLRP